MPSTTPRKTLDTTVKTPEDKLVEVASENFASISPEDVPVLKADAAPSDPEPEVVAAVEEVAAPEPEPQRAPEVPVRPSIHDLIERIDASYQRPDPETGFEGDPLHKYDLVTNKAGEVIKVSFA